MDDRLLELRTISNHKDQVVVCVDNTFMPEFTAKVNKAQQCLENIKDNNLRMAEMQDKYSRATTSQQEKELSQELQQIMLQNQQYSQNLKECMTKIAQDVDESKAKQPDEPETKMKAMQQSALNTKVQEVLQQQQEAQMAYKNSVRQKMTRQTKHLDSNLTDQQIESICNDPKLAQKLLEDRLYGQASTQLQNAVSDIEEKYRDIEKLQQSVELVYRLFADIALLVHQQGLMLDNIEANLVSAKGYVHKAEGSLIDAKKDHQAARKVYLYNNQKMCCIILVGVILIAIIVVPIVTTT